MADFTLGHLIPFRFRAIPSTNSVMLQNWWSKILDDCSACLFLRTNLCYHIIHHQEVICTDFNPATARSRRKKPVLSTRHRQPGTQPEKLAVSRTGLFQWLHDCGCQAGLFFYTQNQFRQNVRKKQNISLESGVYDALRYRLLFLPGSVPAAWWTYNLAKLLWDLNLQGNVESIPNAQVIIKILSPPVATAHLNEEAADRE